MPPTIVKQDMLAAHQQLVAVRALSRLLRWKSFDPYSSMLLHVGQEVYVHAQNKPGSYKDAVGWSWHRVVALHPSLAHTRPLHQKRGRPYMVSYADVRPIPADPNAQSAVLLELTVECTPSGRCVHGVDEDADARDSVVARGFSSLMTASRPRSAHDVGETPANIGGVDFRDPAPKKTQPQVDTQALCEQALDVIGRDTVTRSHLPFLPSWFLDNALDEELDNWSEAVETGTRETFADLDSPKVITNHVLYKVKTDEAG
jgi:hypothetical protein